MWKEKFSVALQKYLRQTFNIIATTNQEIFDQMNQIDNIQRRGIWAHVSQQLDIFASDAHDFYHSEWIKQFYQFIASEHKSLMYKLLQDHIFQINEIDKEQKTHLINHCLELFIQQHPDNNFNKVQLKQQFHHQWNSILRKHETNKKSSKETLQQVKEQKVNEQIITDLQNMINDLLE